MKPVLSSSTISNVNNKKNFRIQESAKAFQILSDKLYSNKIRAVVRELSTNAYDAHVACGKKKKPFKVSLPTTTNKFFSVRDFGPGLTKDEIYEIYTVYFNSTRVMSNDYVGLMGLGSKSPFAYVSQFYISSFQNGIRNDFIAFIDENGIPAISEISSSKIEEPDGLEVKVPVLQSDIDQFVHEAHQLYYWYEIVPDCETAVFTNYKKGAAIIGRTGRIKWAIIKRKTFYYFSNLTLTIVQGNIPYEVKFSNMSVLDKPIYDFFANNVIAIFVPIGTFEVAASRESLAVKDNSVFADYINKVYTSFLKTLFNQYNRKDLIEACYEHAELCKKIYANSLEDIIHQPSGLPVVAFIQHANRIYDGRSHSSSFIPLAKEKYIFAIGSSLSLATKTKKARVLYEKYNKPVIILDYYVEPTSMIFKYIKKDEIFDLKTIKLKTKRQFKVCIIKPFRIEWRLLHEVINNNRKMLFIESRKNKICFKNKMYTILEFSKLIESIIRLFNFDLPELCIISAGTAKKFNIKAKDLKIIENKLIKFIRENTEEIKKFRLLDYCKTIISKKRNDFMIAMSLLKYVDKLSDRAKKVLMKYKEYISKEDKIKTEISHEQIEFLEKFGFLSNNNQLNEIKLPSFEDMYPMLRFVSIYSYENYIDYIIEYMNQVDKCIELSQQKK